MAQPSPSFFACSDPATNVDLPEDMPQPILKTSASASPSGQRKYTTFSDLLVESPDRSSARQQSNPADPPSGWQLPSSDGNRALKTSKRPDETRVNGRRDAAKKAKEEKGKLSMWKLMALTVSMGGSQIAWTVELGYGNPYLISLGLSKELTSLVWLAGPLSGLIAQPLIGAVSDSSRSRYRRRYWIVTATMLLVISGLGLAFTELIAQSLVDLFGGGQGDWDPKSQRYVKNTSIGIAIFAFYCLDFALNALQASLRNLVLDITPGEQLASANAWHGRFNHIGNIVGFTMGFLNLANVPIIRLVGGGQFRKVCIVAMILLVITALVGDPGAIKLNFGTLRDIITTIYDAIKHLPKPVRRVCIVQIAAFMGWFPYLFYSTTYVAEVMGNELGHEPDTDKATRAGSLALLIYSFVAIGAGTLLPYLAARDRRLLKPQTSRDDDDDEDEDEEIENIRAMVREWKAEAARHGRPLKLPTMPFMLRNIWTAGLVLFGLVMGSTFFITKVWQATVAIAVVGICWAIACWVPFAIIMEFLKEMEDSSKSDERSRAGNHGSQAPRQPANAQHRPLHARAASTPDGRWVSLPSSPNMASERTPLARSWSSADIGGTGETMEYTGGPVAGGTIMGIHNLAIVFPQFIVAVVSTFIFRLADGDEAVTPAGHSQAGQNSKSGVAWVLRFGGLMALVGALICRKVPPTKTEKAMRRRLAEMREESEE